MDAMTARRCELQAQVEVYREAFYSDMAELAVPTIANKEHLESVRRMMREDFEKWKTAATKLAAMEVKK